jgi:hypothetical protein
MIKIIATILFFIWVLMVSIELIQGDWFISQKTEEKYLRNISRYTPISKSQVFIYDGRDTLSYIAKAPFGFVNPFAKWYIGHDVGLIKRNSKLSKALDKMVDGFEPPENKLK